MLNPSIDHITMDDDNRHDLTSANRALPVWLALIGALGLILMASLAHAVEPIAYSGAVEPCLSPHGDGERYRGGLQSTGWIDVPDAERAAAIAKLADAYLPITGKIDGVWADHVAHRPDALAFWLDLSQNRTLMEREDQVLLLAGFANDFGDMTVECWVAGPEISATDDFFSLVGATYEGEGVRMTQVNLPDDPARPKTEIFVSRLTPPTPTEPPLAATDALRTRIIFPAPEL